MIEYLVEVLACLSWGPDGFESWKNLEVENLVTHSLSRIESWVLVRTTNTTVCSVVFVILFRPWQSLTKSLYIVVDFSMPDPEGDLWYHHEEADGNAHQGGQALHRVTQPQQQLHLPLNKLEKQRRHRKSSYFVCFFIEEGYRQNKRQRSSLLFGEKNLFNSVPC